MARPVDADPAKAECGAVGERRLKPRVRPGRAHPPEVMWGEKGALGFEPDGLECDLHPLASAPTLPSA